MRRHPIRGSLPCTLSRPAARSCSGRVHHKLRAYLGPTAWAVLEEMMQRSTGDGDHVVGQVSIRSLASSLGLAKDTAARADRRLRDLGVIKAEQLRSDSGVFQTGSYRLDVPTVCLTVDASTTANHRRPHLTTHRRTTSTPQTPATPRTPPRTNNSPSPSTPEGTPP